MTTPNDFELAMYQAYDTSYQVFLQNWRIDRQKALDLMLQHLKPGKQVSVLSVGSGPGDFDVMVVHALVDKLQDDVALRYVAVEPNPFHRRRYDEAMNRPEFARVEFHTHPSAIESFQTDEKFDIIHYTHSMYHMAGREQRLAREAVQMLKDTGFLVITSATQDAMMYKTVFRYADFTGQPVEGQININRMQALIEQDGLKSELTVYPEYLDTTDLFVEGHPHADALMDFFVQSDSRALAPEQRAELLQIVRDNVIERDGRKLVLQPAGTIIVHKQAIQ